MTSTSLNKKMKLSGRTFREYATAYLFIAPWLIGLLAFTLWPFLHSFYLSFMKADIVNVQFAGLQNFKEMFFEDDRFIKSMGVTIKFVLLSVPLKLAFALFVAVLLEKGIRGMSVYRTVYYLPSLIGGSVAAAVMWRKMFGLDGLLNSFLALFGIEGKEWLGHPDHALNLLVLLVVWQFGSSMVIFIAGLKNVPNELYEASMIDGAGKVRTFFHVTLPMLSPIILFNLILQTIGSFQVFTQGYIITQGGPMDETNFAVLYIYELAFRFMRLGYASAMSWVLLFVIALVSGILFFTSRFWVFYENK